MNIADRRGDIYFSTIRTTRMRAFAQQSQYETGDENEQHDTSNTQPSPPHISPTPDTVPTTRRRRILQSVAGTASSVFLPHSTRMGWATTTTTAGSTAAAVAATDLLVVTEVRDQLDVIVQACSVQAWTEAYDLVRVLEEEEEEDAAQSSSLQ